MDVLNSPPLSGCYNGRGKPDPSVVVGLHRPGWLTEVTGEKLEYHQSFSVTVSSPLSSYSRGACWTRPGFSGYLLSSPFSPVSPGRRSAGEIFVETSCRSPARTLSTPRSSEEPQPVQKRSPGMFWWRTQLRKEPQVRLPRLRCLFGYPASQAYHCCWLHDRWLGVPVLWRQSHHLPPHSLRRPLLLDQREHPRYLPGAVPGGHCQG